MYFFDLRSPILEAFFFTASVGLPSLAAILAVGLLGKSFLSRLNSLFDHKPLMGFFFLFAFFFAIGAPFHSYWVYGLQHTVLAILTSDAGAIKHFSLQKRKKNIYSRENAAEQDLKANREPIICGFEM